MTGSLQSPPPGTEQAGAEDLLIAGVTVHALWNPERGGDQYYEAKFLGHVLRQAPKEKKGVKCTLYKVQYLCDKEVATVPLSALRVTSEEADEDFEASGASGGSNSTGSAEPTRSAARPVPDKAEAEEEDQTFHGRQRGRGHARSVQVHSTRSCCRCQPGRPYCYRGDLTPRSNCPSCATYLRLTRVLSCALLCQ